MNLGWGAVGIVAANTVACGLFTIIDMLYTFKTLKVRICYYHWDKIILKPAIGLMLAMLLQSVVGHVNSSVDKTLVYKGTRKKLSSFEAKLLRVRIPVFLAKRFMR